MKLHDVLMTVINADMPIELTIDVDKLELRASRSAGDLCEDTYEELRKREVLSLDVAGNKLSLRLK